MDRLATIFNNTLFRVPDYQRGYAWERAQLEDFWKDLTWLRPGQQHYTGMLTLRAVLPLPTTLPQGTPHRVFHVVDGQQRLTTIYILLSKLINRSNQLLAGQPLPIVSYTYQAATLGGQDIDVFGYEAPAKMEFLRRLLNAGKPIAADEKNEIVTRNVYELNLVHASQFFDVRVNTMSQQQLDDMFIRLTQQLVFDVHEVKSNFDVCAMFESINYRGKKLTKFEVLKNRLIYLAELLGQTNLVDQQHAAALREKIDTVWGEAFDWFGRSKTPLLEDEFLLHHSVMYFGPLPKVQEALDRVLFKEQFSNDRLGEGSQDPITLDVIEQYVDNVRLSSELWTFQNACIESVTINAFPKDKQIVAWLLKLNRLGLRHFRPLILGALNRVARAPRTESVGTLSQLLQAIERFIFIVYGVCDNHSNHPARSHFGGYACNIYYDEPGYSFTEIAKDIQEYLESYDEDGEFVGAFSPSRFVERAHARFIGDQGWRSWDEIKYFLSEWEATLSGERNFVMPESAYRYASIEHIMPQNPAGPGQWQSNLKTLGKRYKYVLDDLGNLTLLGVGANKAVQDIDLASKAAAYSLTSDGREILERAGRRSQWGEEQIQQRGRDMVRFICERWALPGQDDVDSELYFEPDDVLSTNVKAPRQRRAA